MQLLAVKKDEEPHSVKFSIGSPSKEFPNGKATAEVKVYGKTPRQAMNKSAQLFKEALIICKEHNES